MFHPASNYTASASNRGGDDEPPQYLDPEQLKALLLYFNAKKQNLIGEGPVPSVSVKKRNLEVLDPKKDGADVGLIGVGCSTASAGEDTGNISVRLQHKVEAEDAHLEAILGATISSALSKSNVTGDAKVLAGASVPWTKFTEEQFECFYKEGVSLELGHFQKDRNSGGLLTRHLFFRFHLRQLACLQLNVFKFLDRLYKDVAELCIRTKWESEVRVIPELDGHWSDLKITEAYVAPEDMKKCLKYIEDNFPDAFAEHVSVDRKPIRFNVTFQIVDSCVGLYKNDDAIKGAYSLEMYGYAGKTFSKRQQQQGGGNGGVANDLSAIIGGTSNNSDAADDSAAATVPVSSGLDLFGDATTSESAAGDTPPGTESLFPASGQVNFAELYEGSLKRKAFQEAKKNNHIFVCDKNEAKFDIMDPLVLLAPCKGNENAELMKSMIPFLEGRCEAVEDSITPESTEFIGLDQYACFDRAPDLAVNLLMSSPVNIYRVASGLFVSVVCLKLRNINTRTHLVKKATTHGAGDKYVFGNDVRVTPNAHVNCRFRLDKSNCACETFCDAEGWTDKIRADNAKAALGPAYRPDPKKRHSCHHHVPIDYTWLDAQERKIVAYAESAKALKGEAFTPIEYKSVVRFDYLAHDADARNSWMRCYPYSNGHTFFCHNMMPVWRPNFRVHFRNSKLMIQGRLPDTHRPDSKLKVWGVVQEGDSDHAFDFLKTQSKLMSSGEMLNACNKRQMSLREYATKVSLTPYRINILNKDMAKSLDHETNTIISNSERINDEMCLLRETICSPMVAKAIAHYTNSVEADGRVRKSKESRRLMQVFARFCLEKMNVSFLMGVNKRVFHSAVYNITGMRVGGKDVKDVGLHQFTASVTSALVAGDYFSKASAASTEEDNCDLHGEFGGPPKSSAEDKETNYQDMEMFLSIGAQDLLLDDDGDNEYASKNQTGDIGAHVSPSKRHREEEDGGGVPKKAKKGSETITTAPSAMPETTVAPEGDEDISFDG